MINDYIQPGKMLRFPDLYCDKNPLVICPIDDHLIFGPKNGLEKPKDKLKQIVEASPTAILTYYGTVLRNIDLFKNQKIILNLSASIYGPNHTRKVLIHSFETALKLNVSCIATHINILSKHSSEMIGLAGELISIAHKYEMPVCGIIYPRGERNGVDDNKLDLKKNDNWAYADLVARCVSLGVDLGFDLIKTSYTDNKESFKKVVDSSSEIPIMIAGGQLLSEDEAIKKAIDAIKSGARGISFGRNMFGRENSTSFINRLKKELTH